MKHKLLFLFLLAGYFVQGQIPTGYLKQNMRSNVIAHKSDSGLHVPGYATVPNLRTGVWPGSGNIGVDTVAHKLYFYSDTWIEAGSSGGGGNNLNVGSGYRWAIPNTTNIKTFTATNGLTLDSATSNQLGLKLGGTLINNTVITGSTFDLSLTVDSFFISADTINYKDDLFITTDGSSRLSISSDRVLSIAGEEVHINPKFDLSSGNFRFISTDGRVYMDVFSSGANAVFRLGEDEDGSYFEDVNVGATGVKISVFGQARTHGISFFEDSVLLFNLDRNASARMKYVVYDTISHKLAFFDGAAGGGGGSGTVTDFIFTDGGGLDGTVTNSTTTPTLSITSTVSTRQVVFSNSGAFAGSSTFLYNAAGELQVGSGTDRGAFIGQFTGIVDFLSTDATTATIKLTDNGSSGRAGTYMVNDAGAVGTVVLYGQSVVATQLGAPTQSSLQVINVSGSSLAMGTLTNTPIVLATQDVERLRISGTGVITSASDINVPDEAYGSGWNASLEVPTKNAIYDHIEDLITAGTYNPTITGVANLAASSDANFHWRKIGDYYIVWGEVTLDPTTTSTLTRVGISLPVATSVTQTYNLIGTASDDLGTSVRIVGETTNDRAELRFTPTDVTNRVFSVWFKFKWIAP